jgi:general secretion pathway protein I
VNGDDLAIPKNGFSLMEVLVALVILAVSLSAVVRMAGESQSSLIDSQTRTTAAVLADSVMDEILVRDLEDFYGDEGDFGGLEPDYGWNAELEETDADRLAKLTVRVFFKRREREPVQVLERLVLRKGM